MTLPDRKTVALAPLSSEFNAFTGLFAEALRAAGAQPVEYRWGLKALAGCDAILFHWPDQFMKPGDWRSAAEQLMRIQIMKRTRGLKLVWVAHNVLPHDAGAGGSLLRQAFLGSLDGIIYLSHASRALVQEAYRLPRGIVEQVTVHGRYPAPPASVVPPAPRERVRLASIGLVRPYKNLTELVAAARDVAPSELEVSIVGKRHDPDYAARLEAGAAGNGAVRFQLSEDIVPEDELEAAIDAAHGVVLPYRKILNSGSAILALSRARPVLVPATGSMPELADLVGHEWVRLYEGAITGAVLRDFAAHVRGLPEGAAPDLAPLAWERVTRDLRGFLGRLFHQQQHAPQLAAQEAG